MEASMYEDGQYNMNYQQREQMKRKLTLDLGRPTKKQRAHHAFLTSPDLNMLKLESPELERLIMQQNPLVTTTPSALFFPTSKNVTEEQEEYAKGFVDELNKLHEQDPSLRESLVPLSAPGSNPVPVTAIPVTSSSPPQIVVTLSNATYTNLDNRYPSDSSSVTDLDVQVKEEPQTVPSICSSPPMSPIDMEDQERIKLERKRLRNRIAASKCRRRKLEKISTLESKVNGLKDENTELSSIVAKLKDQVCHLKQEVMEHVSSGCQIPFVTLQ